MVPAVASRRAVPRSPAVPRLRRAASYALIYLLLAGPAGMVVKFIALPAVDTLLHSFDRLDARGAVTGFAGLANYGALFRQPLFGVALQATAVYAVASVLLSVAIAFGLAVVLGGAGHASRPLLVALFSPTVMPMIAAANVWLYLLAPQVGPGRWLLSLVGLGGRNLLGEPATALLVLVLLFVWKYAPYFTLFLMAGLQAIPQSVREALRTDDPSGWQAFRRVVLPMLAPMVAFVTTMAMLYSVETIDPVYVMTQGGPNNGTNLLMFYLYQLGFNYFSWGPASALSVLLMASLSTLSGLALIGLERRAFHWQ